jgi:hypothetical protein
MANMVSVREIDAAHLVIGDLKDALEVIHYCLISETQTDDGQDGKEYAATIAKQAINLINGYKFGLVRTNERGLLDG